MNGASDLAGAILTTTVTNVPLTMAVGRLEVPVPRTDVVGVTGINPGSAIYIERSSWSSVFIATYDGMTVEQRKALNGRLVLVLVPARQPILLCTIGD